ncbi:MAG: ferrous iron transport protein B [Prevotellaceae bacterium]|nr:ferrous iron transport protein B [Prevotellaceae bacterium]
MTLKDLKKGQTGVVTSVDVEGALRQHFLDMGLIPGASVRLVKHAPMGDPVELRVHGYELTLRLQDAACIGISLTAKPDEGDEAQLQPVDHDVCHEAEHPGLGETGPRFHGRGAEHGSPRRRLVFALAGNQNSGKTTLFNQLTGANQHVGNFPGVTVERKEGGIKGHPEARVVDLPGIYSLSPYSSEELVSRQFILSEKPDGIINIVDATSVERGLYLTLQLMELDVPMVLCLNMMDEVENNRGVVRINELERLLGIPVIPISALRGEGVEEVVEHALHVAKYRERPLRHDFCSPEDQGGSVHRALHAIMHLTEDHAEREGISVRFAASKLAEGDPMVREQLKLSQRELESLELILEGMEEERGLDRQAAIASMRFSYIRRLAARAIAHPDESKEFRRSKALDRVLTGRWTALPVFVAVMGLVFWLTFDSVGAWLQDGFEGLIDEAVGWLDGVLDVWNISAPVHSMVIDGVCQGVGSVLTFLPMIVLLFFFLSLLEDTGYMARIAFVTDGLMRKIGLSGRSIVPLLIGFGCSVPGIMSTRTLPSERDRKLTIMLTPFMSCTAKIPIYAFFAAAFFPRRAGLVVASMYVIGIVTGVVVSMAERRVLFSGEAVPFVMELPNYRMPAPGNVLRLMWDKARDFLRRAFTVIFLASMIVWFLSSFDWQLHLLSGEEMERSILASISSVVAPLFAPLGCGDWRVITSLVSGLLAKEAVVGTLSTLLGDAQIATLFSTATAFSLMVFCLVYSPCMAAIATVRRELGGRWALGVFLTQCIVAWIVAFVAYLIASLI